MTSHLLRVAAACGAFLLAGFAVAAEPPIIAKARAQIAPDAVLDGVRSIHYSGTLTAPDANKPGQTITRHIEIYLQKPAQQRIEVRGDAIIEVNALDGYDAWRRLIDAKNPAKWEQTLLSPAQIRQLRADVWQNLYYFRGIEKIGGRIEDLGTDKIEGVLCRKLAFHHGDAVVNLRCFNEETGKLVYTGTPDYNTREQGEFVSGGIKFPKTLTIFQKLGDKTVTSTLTFEKIAVNETMPARLFAVPMANEN